MLQNVMLPMSDTKSISVHVVISNADKITCSGSHNEYIYSDNVNTCAVSILCWRLFCLPPWDLVSPIATLLQEKSDQNKTGYIPKVPLLWKRLNDVYFIAYIYVLSSKSG